MPETAFSSGNPKRCLRGQGVFIEKTWLCGHGRFFEDGLCSFQTFVLEDFCFEFASQWYGWCPFFLQSVLSLLTMDFLLIMPMRLYFRENPIDSLNRGAIKTKKEELQLLIFFGWYFSLTIICASLASIMILDQVICPLDGLWIFVAVQNEFLPPCNRVECCPVIMLLPSFHVRMIREGFPTFVGMEPAREFPHGYLFWTGRC